jgi:hypothetical protein
MPLSAGRSRERGQVLVLFAFVLIALLLVSALAVDYGGWLLARRSYQNIADEAAIAGAYQLTNPTGDDCDQGPGVSKQQCARQAAWQSIVDHLGIPARDIDPAVIAVNPAASIAVPWNGYTFWVASPPSDAGSAYPGFASSTKTVFVRVDRHLQAGLSRIISSGTNVGAWATAGRIPENFAIILLCQSGCLGQNADGQVAGTGSNLILESGDIGSNSWVKTSGNNASLALCDGNGGTQSQCSAYMHTPSQCSTTSSVCLIDRWDNTTQTVDTATRYSALALPQVIDPQYRLPTLSATTTPYQCYSTSDSPPPISATSTDVAAQDLPLMLTAAQVPSTPGPVTLGAWPPTGTGIYGQVTDSASPSTGLNNITITAKNESTLATFTATTASVMGTAGRYSFTTLPAGTYTVQAHDATGAYGDLQYTGNIVTAGAMLSLNFSLVANPGTIAGNVSGITPLSGQQIVFSGAGAATATTDATGHYTISLAPGTYTLTPTVPSGYTSTPSTATVTLPAAGSKTQNFVFAPIPTGTIIVTLTDDTTGLGLSGATVTISQQGGSTYSPTSTSGSVYTFANVPTATASSKYTINAALVGWTDRTTVTVNSLTSGQTKSVSKTLWPANCGTSGANKGVWNCDNGSGCTTVTDPTGVGVGCSSYNDTNRIRPGTYKSIIIGNNECAWIDPLGGVPGLTSGQSGGVVYVTDTISIGSNAFLLGDGVTIVLAAGAHADVGNAGGFVINYGGANCDPVPGVPGSCTWRTAGYIGNRTGTQTFAACGTDMDGFADLRRGGFTTGGAAEAARLTWDTSGTPCFQDGDTGSYLTSYKGEIGIAFYLRDSPTCCGGHRFAFSGQMGFLFDGVLYGPHDDIDLGGQGAQAAAGQIVAYTLKYHGDTDIHQRYAGIEVDGPPYLIEPYIGE